MGDDRQDGRMAFCLGKLFLKRRFPRLIGPFGWVDPGLKHRLDVGPTYLEHDLVPG